MRYLDIYRISIIFSDRFEWCASHLEWQRSSELGGHPEQCSKEEESLNFCSNFFPVGLYYQQRDIGHVLI